MDLFDTISAQIKDAMLAKDRVRLEALRGIKKEFLEARSLPGAGGTLSDDAAVKILVKMAKQRRESAEIYSQNGRQEMAADEFLPKQLSDEELTAELQKIIAQTGASSAKDMGKVMGVATKTLAGKADGRLISAKVKELLG